eukprot:gene36679-45248_t
MQLDEDANLWMFQGHAVDIVRNGEIVSEGIWNNNQLCNGRTLWERGAGSLFKVFDGNYLDSKRSGYGKMEYVNGAELEGEWLNDKPQSGLYTQSNGITYQGEFDIRGTQVSGSIIVDMDKAP